MKRLLGAGLVLAAVYATPTLAQEVPQDFDLRTTIRPGQVVTREERRQPARFLNWPTTDQPSFVLHMEQGRAELGIVQMESSRLLRRSWTYTRDRHLQEERQVAGVSVIFLDR